MLTVTGSPQWRTVIGGSRTYVERAAKDLSAVHTATGVRAVTRHHDGVQIRDDADQVHDVDRVVIATHPDQALALLADATADETRLLGAFTYVPSHAVLHTDGSVLPRAPRARASWNYRMDDCTSDDDRVKISYDLKRLQRISDPIRLRRDAQRGRRDRSDAGARGDDVRAPHVHPRVGGRATGGAGA